MTPMIAVHKITRNPDGGRKFIGRYDEHGNPITRANSQSVSPGSVFEPRDDEMRDLLPVGAIRPLEEIELAQYEKGITEGFEPKPREEPKVGRVSAGEFHA